MPAPVLEVGSTRASTVTSWLMEAAGAALIEVGVRRLQTDGWWAR